MTRGFGRPAQPPNQPVASSGALAFLRFQELGDPLRETPLLKAGRALALQLSLQLLHPAVGPVEVESGRVEAARKQPAGERLRFALVGDLDRVLRSTLGDDQVSSRARRRGQLAQLRGLAVGSEDIRGRRRNRAGSGRSAARRPT